MKEKWNPKKLEEMKLQIEKNKSSMQARNKEIQETENNSKGLFTVR